MYHCEKKALAAQLELCVAHPSMTVNIKMCADCHACFKAASSFFNTSIACDDGSHVHTFSDGGCTCNDCWR